MALADRVKLAMDMDGPPPWTNDNVVPEENVDKEDEEKDKLNDDEQGCTRLLEEPDTKVLDLLSDEWD